MTALELFTPAPPRIRRRGPPEDELVCRRHLVAPRARRVQPSLYGERFGLERLLEQLRGLLLGGGLRRFRRGFLQRLARHHRVAPDEVAPERVEREADHVLRFQDYGDLLVGHSVRDRPRECRVEFFE